ncbi:MAG: TMEM175 family protein, partial [Actinomycetota bacterium]
LRPLLPTFLAYALSFVILGIYWNNHHHMLQLTKRINGGVLWANLHLLFWLSLIPFGTEWMGKDGFAKVPTAVYGGVLLAAAIAYYVLQLAILSEDANAKLAVALGSDLKGKLSPAIYAVAIPLTFADRRLGIAGYVIVALMWLVPDRRLEARFAHQGAEGTGGEPNAQPETRRGSPR